MKYTHYEKESHFNYGEFAIIKSQAGLNSYKLSVKGLEGNAAYK